MTLTKTILPALLGSIALAATAPAAITTSGDFKTGTPTATFTITAPITFTITADYISGSGIIMVLDGWATPENASVPAPPTVGNMVSYKIDGGITQTVPLNTIFDEYPMNLGAYTMDDGLIWMGDIAVTTGQTLTILAQTWTFDAAGAEFNTPPALFEGNAFLVGNDSQIIMSGLVPVPEPTTALLGAIGTLALLRRRRA